MNFIEKIGDEHLMALGLGLAGAHRVGKTTVARKLAENNDCPFVESQTSTIAKDMGVKVRMGMPFEERLAFQNRVLDVAEKQYAEHNGLFIADRTPLDFAAYAALDFNAATATIDQDIALSEYMKRCTAVTNRHFFHIGIIQPGIPYQVGEGKPAPRPVYQELLNSLIIGLSWSDDIIAAVNIIERCITNTDERVKALTDSFSDEISGYRATLGESLSLQ